MTRRSSLALAGAVALVLLSGCAQPASPGGSIAGAVLPAPAADGEVAGLGLVRQADGEEAQFCLGAVAESFPPQCVGPVVVDWDWAATDMEETASGVTFGSYALQGTWDGTQFTPTQPAIPLALYDAAAVGPDPRLDPANAGAGEEAALRGIQAELTEANGSVLQYAQIDNGYLFVGVAFDDGSVQDAVDGWYGRDMVAVVSVLREVG